MRLLILFVLAGVTISYLFIGAAVFHKLESDTEKGTKSSSRELLRIFRQNASCVSKEILDGLIQDVIAAYDKGVLVTHTRESLDNWDLWSSFFFATTVVTTIGYGNISPSTTEGRVFCILYALVGIPLVTVFLSGIGTKLLKPFKWIRNKSKTSRTRIATSIVINLLGYGFLIFFPAYWFHRVEDWTFFDSVYFGVVSLTTIGFGDFVPGKLDNRAFRQVVTLLWLFVGLAWVVMIISDISDHLTSSVNTIGKKKQKAADNTTLNTIDEDATDNDIEDTKLSTL